MTKHNLQFFKAIRFNVDFSPTLCLLYPITINIEQWIFIYKWLILKNLDITRTLGPQQYCHKTSIEFIYTYDQSTADGILEFNTNLNQPGNY